MPRKSQADSRPHSDPGELNEERRFDAWRRFATQVLRLPTIREKPACRRARFRAPREVPCILRYTRRYQHRLPVIRKALLAELARREAEQAQA
ncbi:MAG: hypothetical protein Q8P46_08705 [Hyphomicrobiales bacterium]|nr:hypothetical protein [Hyphomicrobiales bacterium]